MKQFVFIFLIVIPWAAWSQNEETKPSEKEAQKEEVRRIEKEERIIERNSHHDDSNHDHRMDRIEREERIVNGKKEVKEFRYREIPKGKIKESYDLADFSAVRKKRNVGIGLLIGGGVFTIGGLTTMAISFIDQDENDDYYFSDDPNPYLLVAGAGTTLLGASAFTTGAILTITNSIKLSKMKKHQKDHMWSLYIGQNANGVSFGLKF